MSHGGLLQMKSKKARFLTFLGTRMQEANQCLQVRCVVIYRIPTGTLWKGRSHLSPLTAGNVPAAAPEPGQS